MILKDILMKRQKKIVFDASFDASLDFSPNPIFSELRSHLMSQTKKIILYDDLVFSFFFYEILFDFLD